ncbi:uncharacterized protein MELLADRAFT_124345 [Melampsora larici-populina 98AG31]|uniref:Secreted protein n=1 Tax=Melampsora larici-populina (strain 98AG31 / pathotype 3-4-7) TaxID=747676 RepID=F4RVR2_MELLP|nr:uncharacterized protein MELLADRAFT_124345 [Melampsora larici-populina 98AG31]EGG03540.1 secreted protein [Melampsora larici-populina 98AG31]
MSSPSHFKSFLSFHIKFDFLNFLKCLSVLSFFNFYVLAGYSVQDCGIAWAPNIQLLGHPPIGHPGYYCKNSGGVEYGCEVCHTLQQGFWHACRWRPAWGARCGDQGLSCGYMSTDCTDEIICSKGYSYYGEYAHCWDDDRRYKCVPDGNQRPITHTVCSKCLQGTAKQSGGPVW